MVKSKKHKGSKKGNKKPVGKKDKLMTDESNRKEAKADGPNEAENDCSGSVNIIQMGSSSKEIVTADNIDGKENVATGIFYEEDNTENLFEYAQSLLKSVEITEMSIPGVMETSYPRKDSFDSLMENLYANRRQQYLQFEEDMIALRNEKSELKKQGIFFSEPETPEVIVVDLEKIQLSRDETTNLRDVVSKLKIGEDSANERSHCDWFNDYNELTGGSTKNATGGRKGKECIGESTNKVKDLERKDHMEGMDTEEKEIPELGELEIFRVENMALKHFQSDQKLEKGGESKSTVNIEQLNLSSTNKRHLQAAAEIETQDKTGFTASMENEEIEKETNSKSFNEHDEIFVELDKSKEIDFAFEINGDKHISAGGDHYSDSFEEKVDMTFYYKDQNILVTFTGNHVFVSTQNNEFNIIVQNNNPTDSTNEAT